MSLEPGTIAGREGFIRRLEKQLGRSKPLSEPPARVEKGVPAFYADRQLSKDDMLKLFVHHWTTLTGKVLLVKEADAGPAACAYLLEICAEQGVDRVVRWEHDGLIKLGIDSYLADQGIRVVPWKDAGESEQVSDEDGTISNWSKRSLLLQAAEQCRIGVVWPDYALAETGTVVLGARGGHGRSVSLLPEILVAIFRADQLVRRMGDAFSAMSTPEDNAFILPSSINLITGPSRSADIENDLTIGIHGPGKVYAVIIE